MKINFLLNQFKCDRTYTEDESCYGRSESFIE